MNFGLFKGKITVFLQKLNWLIQYLLKLNKNCRCAQFWLMPLILLRFYAGRLCVYESAPGTSSFQAWHYPYCGHDLLLEKVAALIKVAFWLQVAYRHSRHEFLQDKRGPSDPLWIWIWNKFKVQFPMFKIVCRVQIKFVISFPFFPSIGVAYVCVYGRTILGHWQLMEERVWTKHYFSVHFTTSSCRPM